MIKETKVEVFSFFLRVKFYLPLYSIGVEAVAVEEENPVVVRVLISVDHVHVSEHIAVRKYNRVRQSGLETNSFEGFGGPRHSKSIYVISISNSCEEKIRSIVVDFPFLS